MNIYLAGGAVRDLLLGRPLADRDYLITEISEQALLKRFPHAQKVGAAFPVFLIDGIEFSFLRMPSLEEELLARDLTVNAMLLDESGELICHPLALEDLHNKKLRPASSTAFTTDPLRVFRAARFFARFSDFEPTKELVAQFREVSDKNLLETISAERIGQELRKSFSTPKPSNFFTLLRQGNCLKYWFKELEKKPSFQDIENNLTHIATSPNKYNEITIWMAITSCLHHKKNTSIRIDLLKPDTKTAKQAQNLGKRIRLPNRLITAGIQAAQWYTIGTNYAEIEATLKVDLLINLNNQYLIRPFFELISIAEMKDFTAQATCDLQKILAIRLTPEDQNQGAHSGIKLRALRADILK